ncbi:MAG TPA: thiamine phosphate synthase [Opitutaceae bacterium]
MLVAVISPEGDDPREAAALEGFLSAGLRRYHVRKPSWNRDRLEAWLRALPAAWRGSLVLHGEPGLARGLGLAGCHQRDDGGFPGGFSRACHDMDGLARALPAYSQVIFGPVSSSISKPGYGPAQSAPWAQLTGLLARRAPGDARVLAVGGVTPDLLPRCLELGFDGAALLGYIWSDKDPLAAYLRVRDADDARKGACHAA